MTQVATSLIIHHRRNYGVGHLMFILNGQSDDKTTTAIIFPIHAFGQHSVFW